MAENWQFYMARVDDQPASIMVGVGLGVSAPVAGFGELGYLRVYMRAPRPDGLSSQEEFEALSALGDAVTAAITAGGATIYVGRNTSGGNRDFYFYTSDPCFDQRVVAAMAGWQQYEFDSGRRLDANWDTYLNFLYPSGEDFQRISNRNVVDQLVAQGDDPGKPREIDHFAFFPTQAARAAFIAWLPEQGFSIDAPEPGDGGKYLAAFHRVDAPRQIDDVTIELYRAVRAQGGEYDGWGCNVTA